MSNQLYDYLIKWKHVEGGNWDDPDDFRHRTYVTEKTGRVKAHNLDEAMAKLGITDPASITLLNKEEL